MRIAIISDIHGNKNALDEVLEDIEGQKVDQIICAGDFIDPLPESKIVWQLLKDLSIPMIRGNHEDYIVSVHRDGDSSVYNSGENWKPVRATAKLFSQVDTEEIAQLPLKIFINEMNVLICHASPSSNKKGWKKSIDGELAKDLLAEPAATIVCGHWHSINEQSWENKKLLMIGSVGVPLHGKHQAEYSILESRNGDLSVENRFVDYDVESTVKKYVESGFVAESAPISWLLLDEIIAAERRISPFIAWRNSDSAIADLKWQEAAELYFRKINRWDQIKKAAKI